MKQHCLFLTALFTYIVVGCQCGHSESDNELLSRLEALEKKDQLRELRQQELQNELDREIEQRRHVEVELAEVKQRLHDHEARIDHQHSENNQQNEILKKLKLRIGNAGKVHDARTLINKRQTGFLETAVFHATLDQDSGLEHITVGSTIPFPNTKLNIGNGYDNNTSTFTAPMAGVYIFSVSISSYWNDHGEVHVGVMKNGQYIAGAYVDDIGGPPEQGSVTIPLQLEIGDKVWIKHVVHDDGALYGGGLTSFMGCLVFAF